MVLDGKKTYILAGLIIVAGVLFKFEVMEVDNYLAVMSVLTGGAFAALRHGVKNG